MTVDGCGLAMRAELNRVMLSHLASVSCSSLESENDIYCIVVHQYTRTNRLHLY